MLSEPGVAALLPGGGGSHTSTAFFCSSPTLPYFPLLFVRPASFVALHHLFRWAAIAQLGVEKPSFWGLHNCALAKIIDGPFPAQISDLRLASRGAGWDLGHLLVQ